jgi:DNA modification methylase
VSKPGDLWQLGRHSLLCGTALDAASYHALLRGARAHMVFTDPPYNVPIQGHASGRGAIQHREFAMAAGEMDQVEFTSFLTRSCSLMARHSVVGALHFLCMDWRHTSEILEAGTLAYTDLKNVCVWVKDNGGMGSLYRSQHELVFVFKHGSGLHRNNVQLGQYGRNRTNVWHYPCANTFSRQSDEGSLVALHPTVKPVALVADAILDCSARGDVVLDPFLGSGTTLLYVDTVIRRWQAYAGEKATHFATGKRFDDVAAEAKVRHDR